MTDDVSFDNLQRDRQSMPADVLAELQAADVEADYRARPAYQQNDYLAWIGRAQRPETRAKRIEQMIEELREGGVYMGMDHAPSRRTDDR
ncbi:YdeI/OmpD-associated family protein [Sinomonas sp. ASV322]|uniref:YdeI/OmpD-associated family protein n=1 Tax=Sinomonas sp. ASV322 TaxID=3041920 RepID=UPI0027DAEE81|nr:YdeI/OmpD-associated family protein [Sinomonas sp. ASV322]MDQ4503373.1 YdeI/OmpD-associated family protein [Sinomonas sp. ASV322]